MRVEVDTTLCQGTAYCESDASLHDRVDEAERLCPSRAITL